MLSSAMATDGFGNNVRQPSGPPGLVSRLPAVKQPKAISRGPPLRLTRGRILGEFDWSLAKSLALQTALQTAGTVQCGAVLLDLAPWHPRPSSKRWWLSASWLPYYLGQLEQWLRCALLFDFPSLFFICHPQTRCARRALIVTFILFFCSILVAHSRSIHALFAY